MGLKFKMNNEQMTLRGTLVGHKGWVTKIATTPAIPEMILSASRDKSLIVWQLTRGEAHGGLPNKRLCGHSHFVSDVVISSDGQFALSGSWDGDLRLWNLNAGVTTRRFQGHTKDVMSVAFSGDNRKIVSASRDKTIKLWNTLGQCKYTIVEDGHTDWASCVQFSPNPNSPIIVSCGWDKVVKVWNLANCKLKTNHYGHTAFISAVTVSPDGSLCASGGKDGQAMLWIFLKANTCTLYPTVKQRSALFPSHQTDTGCALHADPPSRFGTWKAKLYLTNSSPC